jgi:hypothetical protein
MIVKNIVAAWRKWDLLQPRDDVGKIKDRSRSVCVAGTDRSREWLKRQRAAVKGGYGSRVKTFWLAEATGVSAEDMTAREVSYALNPEDEAVCWPNKPECSACVTYNLFEFPCPMTKA